MEPDFNILGYILDIRFSETLQVILMCNLSGKSLMMKKESEVKGYGTIRADLLCKSPVLIYVPWEDPGDTPSLEQQKAGQGMRRLFKKLSEGCPLKYTIYSRRCCHTALLSSAKMYDSRIAGIRCYLLIAKSTR